MNIGGIDTPFDDCDADDATIDDTGALLSTVFSDLVIKKQRAFLLANTGGVNLLVGKNGAGAKFPILPGSTVTLYAKDLGKIWIKAASATCTAAIFQAI